MTTNAMIVTVPMRIAKSLTVMTVQTIHAHTVAGAVTCVRHTKRPMTTGAINVGRIDTAPRFWYN
jgi:hypothetical protein